MKNHIKALPIFINFDHIPNSFTAVTNKWLMIIGKIFHIIYNI